MNAPVFARSPVARYTQALRRDIDSFWLMAAKDAGLAYATAVDLFDQTMRTHQTGRPIALLPACQNINSAAESWSIAARMIVAYCSVAIDATMAEEMQERLEIIHSVFQSVENQITEPERKGLIDIAKSHAHLVTTEKAFLLHADRGFQNRRALTHVEDINDRLRRAFPWGRDEVRCGAILNHTYANMYPPRTAKLALETLLRTFAVGQE